MNGLFAVTTANTDTVDDVTLLGLLDERERRITASSSTSSVMLLLKVLFGELLESIWQPEQFQPFEKGVDLGRENRNEVGGREGGRIGEGTSRLANDWSKKLADKSKTLGMPVN